MSEQGQLEFRQAMADFKAMFPHLDLDMIEKILRQNNGIVDATIDHLLALTVADNDEDQYATIPSASNTSVPHRPPSAANVHRSSNSAAPPTQRPAPQRTAEPPQPQNGPAIGMLIDLDDGFSSSSNATFQPNSTYDQLPQLDEFSHLSGAYHHEASGRNLHYDAVSPSAHSRSANSSVAHGSFMSPQSQVNGSDPYGYSTPSNNPTNVEANAFKSEPQQGRTGGLQRRAGDERRSGQLSNEASDSRQQHNQYVHGRSISMVETERPRRPPAPNRRAAAASGGQHNANNSRRSSQTEPTHNQISAELLQEKLAENQFRRRSLMERSSSLRQPAGFVPPGANASRGANPPELYLDEIDELNNEEQILSDEYLAIMLQNEEFVTSLRNDDEFMNELRRDALIGEREGDQTHRNDELERARFENRKSVIDRAQRTRESFSGQSRADEEPMARSGGSNLQRSDTPNRASISMFGARRTLEDHDRATRSAADASSRLSDRRTVVQPSSRASVANGSVSGSGSGSQQRAAGADAVAETDPTGGYGEDRVPDLDAFPFSRTIQSDETADIQRQLKSMRGSTRKKLTVLAKKFFSKSYRKKLTDVNQRFYKQMNVIGSEPTFGLLDEDDAEYATLQQAAAAKQQQQQQPSQLFATSTNAPQSNSNQSEAAGDGDGDGEDRPVRRYNLDRY